MIDDLTTIGMAKLNSTSPLPAVDDIDRCLPQTQCGQCDYLDCLAYARAIESGQADINQCPPGGAASIAALAQLLGRAATPLNPVHASRRQPLRRAFIREADCIGCKLCIKACPVDCIIGTAKLMHTVLAADCLGCRLCLPACPTDCIELVAPPPTNYEPMDSPAHGARGGAATSLAGGDAPSMWPQFGQRQVEKSRRRAQQKRRRLARHTANKAGESSPRSEQPDAPPPSKADLKKEITAALQRTAARQPNRPATHLATHQAAK